MAVKTVQVVLNGTTHTLTLNESTGLYEATITAPDKSSYNETNGYYPVTVIAEDDAGNKAEVDDTDSTFGDILKLQVKETTAPVITITSPTESEITSVATPRITWQITDDDSGVDLDTISITINDGTPITTGITKTQISGGYQCYYDITDALADGTNTIKVDGSDFDENAAVQRTVNFVVDTTPPVLSVTSPENNLVTSSSTITVAGTTNDITSSPVTLTVQVNDGETQEVEVDSGGTFSTDIQINSGVNTIVITATDKAGKTSSITRTVTVDSGAPVISAITITPNPATAGGLITITVEVTD